VKKKSNDDDIINLSSSILVLEDKKSKEDKQGKDDKERKDGKEGKVQKERLALTSSASFCSRLVQTCVALIKAVILLVVVVCVALAFFNTDVVMEELAFAWVVQLKEEVEKQVRRK
jgi:hypothetical protein